MPIRHRLFIIRPIIFSMYIALILRRTSFEVSDVQAFIVVTTTFTWRNPDMSCTAANRRQLFEPRFYRFVYCSFRLAFQTRRFDGHVPARRALVFPQVHRSRPTFLVVRAHQCVFHLHHHRRYWLLKTAPFSDTAARPLQAPWRVASRKATSCDASSPIARGKRQDCVAGSRAPVYTIVTDE